MTTLYRANPRQEWQAVSVVCALPMGWVLLQHADGRPLPGRFAALACELRETGSTLVFHKPGRRET
jgi:hypothetical protein